MHNPNEIYFVTTNRGKVYTAKRILSRYGYSVMQKKDFIDEPEHTNNPRLIAKAKIMEASKRYSKALMCEDGGFFVDALDGEPGVKVKGYLEKHGLAGLLKRLKGETNRKAYFWSALAYIEPGWKEPVYFDGKTHGVLAEEPRGEMRSYSWSELHLAFIPDLYEKTLAEMDQDEYAQFSNRQTSNIMMLGEFLKNKGQL
jgi:XTP/dITP diphosphohydrolase